MAVVNILNSGFAGFRSTPRNILTIRTKVLTRAAKVQREKMVFTSFHMVSHTFISLGDAGGMSVVHRILLIIFIPTLRINDFRDKPMPCIPVGRPSREEQQLRTRP